MKHLRNNKGMTLTEIVVAMAIIGIMAVVFLQLFVLGFKVIVGAGKRTQAANQAQRALENRLGGLEVNTIPNITSPVEPPTANVIIEFSGLAPITVSGKVEQVEYDDGKRSITLSTFIPSP